MKSNTLKRIAPLMIIMAGMLWGCVGMFTKYMYSLGFSPFQVSMLRCFVAAVCIIFIIGVKNSSQLKLRSWKDISFFLISGTFGIGMSYSAYFVTMQRSSLSIAAVMLYSAPVMVTILAAIVFKEKLTITKIISVVMAFSGCIIMSGILGGEGTSLSASTIIVGFLAGFSYALYNVGSRMALKYYSTFTVTAYTFLFAFLGLVIITPVKETINLLAAHPASIAVALIMGLGITLFPFTLYVMALNYVEVSKASVMSIMEPVVATTLGILVFKEEFTMNIGIAMAVIFAAVLLINIKVKPRHEKFKAEASIKSDEDNSWMTEHRISREAAKKREAKENAEFAFKHAGK